MQNRTNIRKTGILRSLSLIVYQQYDVLRITQDTRVHPFSNLTRILGDFTLFG